MRKEYINKFAWSKIFAFLKHCKNIYIKTERHCKQFIEAVFWIMRTGAQWRELPELYGNWNSIFSRFNSWSKKGIWEKMFNFCIENPDLEYVIIDSTIVRAHACSAGYGKQEIEGLGRSKGGFTSKIHAKTDALGNPLQFVVTPGQQNDIMQADTLLDNVYDSFVLADKGYSSNKLISKIDLHRCIAVIPPRKNIKKKWTYDKDIYKERHAVECLFSKMKHFRRVSARFDKSVRNFLSFLSFVGACLWLR